MVTGIARALGLDLGDVGKRKNNEDPRFQNRPPDTMRAVIKERNDEADVWGWKFPGAGSYLPDLMRSIRNPCFIVVYRDPVAAALSQARLDRKFNSRTPRLALHESSANNTANTGLVLATDRPCLLVSNERATQQPEALIDDVADFLGVPAPSGGLRSRILEYVGPGGYKSFDEYFGEGSADGAAGGAADSGSTGRVRRGLGRLRGRS